MFLVLLNTVLSAVILPIAYLEISSMSTASLSLPVLAKYFLLLLLLFIEWFALAYNTSHIINTYLESAGVHSFLVEDEDQDKVSRAKIKICLLIALVVMAISFSVTLLLS